MASDSSALEKGEFEQDTLLLEATWREPAVGNVSRAGPIVFRWRVILAGTGLIGVACVALVAWSRHRSVQGHSASPAIFPEMKTEQSGFAEQVSAAVQVAHYRETTGTLPGEYYGNGGQSWQQWGQRGNASTTSAAAASDASSPAGSRLVLKVGNAPENPLVPDEHMHDGNNCEDGEENFMGLCYLSCKNLTDGKYPYRGTPFSCCQTHPCEVLKEKYGGMTPCQGYDMSAEGGCPHKPGICLTDEEMFLGLCYKKCSLLTDGEYPFRSALLTCCQEDTELACLNPAKVKTGARFGKGGGIGDHDPSTPHGVHAPRASWTEVPMDHDRIVQLLNETGEFGAKPAEHMHDGNKCDDSEEIYGGLCYKKCSLLTNSSSSVRGSAFSCCDSSPCTITNQHWGGWIPCSGFDVNGQGSCPHAPGACLEVEEYYLGLCYGKCSLLTQGKYPYRTAPATCCKDKGVLECLNPFSGDSETKPSLLVSGGSGDHDGSTPRGIHRPLTSLTEA